MIHQVSEFYRQGVIRPLNGRAKDDLEQFRVSNSIRCEWLPILDDDQFERIWKSGLLQTIGRECTLHFSDYEETLLEADRVCKAINAVKESLLHTSNDSSNLFAEALLSLLIDAQSSGMPVLFVL